MLVQSFFRPFSDDYMLVFTSDDFVIHLNLKSLLIEENKFSRELKTVLNRANLPFEQVL